MRLGICIIFTLLLGGLVAIGMQTNPSTVSGTVRGADGSLPEMIVYLEPVDPGSKYPIPTTPAEISQKGAQFAPSLLVISVGQQVLFKNDEDRPIEHNVFSRSPAKPFDLGLYKPPVAKPVTFDTPGVVRLFCSIHRTMDGIIYVCPTPFWSRVAPDGKYEITGVPPGQWKLKTWQRNARYNEQDMPLTITGATTMNLEMNRK